MVSHALTLALIRVTLVTVHVHFQEPIIIIRLSQPLTIEEETGDGRSEVYLALDFHFQYIAWLVLW